MTAKCGTEGQDNAQDTFKKEVTSDKADGQAAASEAKRQLSVFSCWDRLVRASGRIKSGRCVCDLMAMTTLTMEGGGC